MSGKERLESLLGPEGELAKGKGQLVGDALNKLQEAKELLEQEKRNLTPRTVNLYKLQLKSLGRKLKARKQAAEEAAQQTEEKKAEDSTLQTELDDHLKEIEESLKKPKAFLVKNVESLTLRMSRAIEVAQIVLPKEKRAGVVGDLRKKRHDILGLKDTSVGGGKKKDNRLGRDSEDDRKEYFDSDEVLSKKVKALAELIRKSKHMTCFTGAGISTSTGIPDFRSGFDTVLDVGAGAWTKRDAKLDNNKPNRAKGKGLNLLLKSLQKKPAKGKKQPTRKTSTLNAIPSITHRALVVLQKKGRLKHIISQNCDGLHLRSGFPAKNLSELHGNSNLEKCISCGKAYLRDFRCSGSGRQHLTGRKCKICGGNLRDTIINFKEPLTKEVIDGAKSNAEKSDLMLALGSSLMVYPAAKMPGHIGANKQKDLVIVNLQATALDSLASIRIFSTIDKVFELLMKELGWEIPRWHLQRRLKATVKPVDDKNQRQKLVLEAFDGEGTPMSLISGLRVNGRGQAGKRKPVDTKTVDLDEKGDSLRVTVEFQGHYGEPPFSFKLPKEGGTYEFSIAFDPLKRPPVWQAKNSGDEDMKDDNE